MLPRSTPALRAAARPRQLLPRASRRLNSSNQAPSSPPPASNPHRAFYSSYGPPVLKVFLGALFTYQALYWSWLKLEAVEEKQVKSGEIKELEGQLKGLKGEKEEKKA